LKIESKHPLDGATAMSAYVSYREGQLVSSIQGLRREANEVPKYQNKVLTTGDLLQSVEQLKESYRRVLSAHAQYKTAMKQYRDVLPRAPSSFQQAAEHFRGLSKDPSIPEFVRNNYAKLATNCDSGLLAVKLRAASYETIDVEITNTMVLAKHVEDFLGNYEHYLRLFPAHDPTKEREALRAELKIFIQRFADFQRTIDTIVEPAPSALPPTRPVALGVR
jgi:hypothetical protein